jgi:D-alanyl-D-alanine carboxypeptidase (penicillin-binding protein 5/6)
VLTLVLVTVLTGRHEQGHRRQAQRPGPALAQAGAPPASTPPRPFYSPEPVSINMTPATPPLPLDPPQVQARAAIVIDMQRMEALYAREPHAQQPIASTTKIMTALVALEQADLTTEITVPPGATRVEPNHMGLRAGEKLSVRDLLYGLLLDSGNDAAETLAEGIAGRATFLQMMNDKAQALGLQHTHFTNPAGFDDQEHYSSAYDLAVLASYAMQKHTVFRELAATKRHVIARTPQHGWFGPTNLNQLLWTYSGATGVKPGWTEQAGYTLVASATRGERSVLTVVLGATRHFTESALLLDYGFTRLGRS